MLTRGGQLPLLLSSEVRQEEEKMGMRRGSTSLTHCPAAVCGRDCHGTTRGSCHLSGLSALGSCFIRNFPFLPYMYGGTDLSACKGCFCPWDSVSLYQLLGASSALTVCPVDTLYM